jgi:hypothetical protein
MAFYHRAPLPGAVILTGRRCGHDEDKNDNERHALHDRLQSRV